jgi:hypothetical protein
MVLGLESLKNFPKSREFKKIGAFVRYPTLVKEEEITRKGVTGMSKYEIIDCILEINRTARHEFLDQFSTEDLDQYLEHLMEVDLEEVALCA